MSEEFLMRLVLLAGDQGARILLKRLCNGKSPQKTPPSCHDMRRFSSCHGKKAASVARQLWALFLRIITPPRNGAKNALL